MSIERAIVNRFQAALNAGGLTDQQFAEKGVVPPPGFWYDDVTATWLPPEIALMPLAQEVQEFLRLT